MSDQPAEPILNLVGEKVALGPNRRELLPLYQQWVNDFVVTRTLGLPLRPTTRESEEARYERVAQPSGEEVTFTIYERERLRPIGITQLHDIDHLHRTAEFNIFVGEKDCWGRGYGTEVARLMLDYGFTALGLHNIMLRVFTNNDRGIRAWRRAGFREIGRRSESYRIGRAVHDTIFMECLASDFTPPG